MKTIYVMLLNINKHTTSLQCVHYCWIFKWVKMLVI